MTKSWLVERIRAAAAERSALLPVHATFGVYAVDAEPGHSAFGLDMGPWALDRVGQLCPGAFMVAADAALGSAVNTALADGLTVASLTLSAQFVTLDPGAAGRFTVHATAGHLGSTSGFSAGRIVDDTGRLIAEISTQCAYRRLASPPVSARQTIDIADAAWPAATGTGLAPIAERQAGARLLELSDGRVRVRAEAGPAVRNSFGAMQGGVLALLAEQAISTCLTSGSPALRRADTMELQVSYFRGVRADQPGVDVTARCEHAGRRFALARARARDAAGHLVITATGSRYAG